MPVTYAAVGASKDRDLLRFPPEGTTPYEETLRLGSGQERFLAASSLLMTWGAQRGNGVRVTEVEQGSGEFYSGLDFDADGIPQAASAVEEHFGPDGEPYVTAGTTATLQAEGRAERAVLVVYTINEERRVGFAWGTRDEAGAVGEQLFTVELREDDTVWAVARGFLMAPKSGILGLRAKADLRQALDAVKAQLQALAPGGRKPEAERAGAELSAPDPGDTDGLAEAGEPAPVPDPAAEPDPAIEPGPEAVADPAGAPESPVEPESAVDADPVIAPDRDAELDPEAEPETGAAPEPAPAPDRDDAAADARPADAHRRRPSKPQQP